MTGVILIATGAAIVVALGGFFFWAALENAQARGEADQKAHDLQAQVKSASDTAALEDDLGEAAAQHPSDDQIEQRLKDHDF